VTANPGDLTIVTTCKGRLSHLKQSLPLMLNQKGAKVVVVDYDCPDGTADWVRSNHPQAAVVHKTDQPGFRMSCARNLGAAAVNTDWLAFIDADILLSPDFVEAILPLLRPNRYLRAHPVSKQTWGSFVCARDLFRKSGGYDETYRGWGAEDDDLYEAMEWVGARGASFPGTLLSEIFHSEAVRMRYHDTEKVTSHRINQLYRRIKFDLMNIIRTPLPEAQRQTIYDRANEVFRDLENKRLTEATIKLTLPELFFGPPDSERPAAEVGAAVFARTIVYGIRISA